MRGASWRTALVGVLALATSMLVGCTVVTGEQQPLPQVDVVEFDDGGVVDVASLRGPLLINFWATTCTTCREEMPVLQAFHERHGDKVEVIGIDFQETQHDAARQLIADTGVTYRLLSDDLGDLNGADPLPNLQGLPLQVFVDKDGNVAYQMYGVFDSVEEIEQLVDEHLGVDL